MKRTRYNKNQRRDPAVAVYLQLMAEDNSQQLRTLRQMLGRALGEELTGRQREMLALYYNERKNQTEIARQLDLAPSTVCRTLKRGERRLLRCLRYGGAELLRASLEQDLPIDKRTGFGP